MYIEQLQIQPYKGDAKGNLETISLSDEDNRAAHRGSTIGNARNFARDLVNAPADDIYPETLADAALNLASKDICIDVWELKNSNLKTWWEP